MQHIHIVQRLQAEDHVKRVEPDVLLVKVLAVFLVALDFAEEIAPVLVLHYQVELGGFVIEYGLLVADDIGGLDGCHEPDFV